MLRFLWAKKRTAVALIAMAFLAIPAFLPACGDDEESEVTDDSGNSLELTILKRPASGACPETAEAAAQAVPASLSSLEVSVVEKSTDKELVKATLKDVKKGASAMVKDIPPGKSVKIVLKATSGDATLVGSVDVCYDESGQAATENGLPACIFVAGKKQYVKVVLSAQKGSSCTADVLDVGRVFHTATRLPDGKVLITGGFSSYDPSTQQFSATKAVELYDPQTGEFTRLPDLDRPRAMHTATLLPGGFVMIAGGTETAYYTSSSGTAIIRPASPQASYVLFIYQPTLGQMDFNRDQNGTVKVRKMNMGRALHTATCIPLGSNNKLKNCVETDGTEAADYLLLLSGGDGYKESEDASGQPIVVWSSSTFEAFIMAKEANLTPKILPISIDKDVLNPPRVGHQAFFVANQKVILFGGTPSADNSIQMYTSPASWQEAQQGNHGKVEALSLTANQVSSPDFLAARFAKSVRYTDTKNDAFLIVGGAIYHNSRPDFSGDLAGNPLPLFFSLTSGAGVYQAEYSSPSSAHIFHCAARADSGWVFAIGGAADQTLSVINSTIDSFRIDPSSGKGQYVTLPITLNTPRFGHECTPLKDNSILVTGGLSNISAASMLRSAEIVRFE